MVCLEVDCTRAKHDWSEARGGERMGGSYRFYRHSLWNFCFQSRLWPHDQWRSAGKGHQFHESHPKWHQEHWHYLTEFLLEYTYIGMFRHLHCCGCSYPCPWTRRIVWCLQHPFKHYLNRAEPGPHWWIWGKEQESKELLGSPFNFICDLKTWCELGDLWRLCFLEILPQQLRCMGSDRNGEVPAHVICQIATEQICLTCFSNTEQAWRHAAQNLRKEASSWQNPH